MGSESKQHLVVCPLCKGKKIEIRPRNQIEHSRCSLCDGDGFVDIAHVCFCGSATFFEGTLNNKTVKYCGNTNCLKELTK